MQIVKILKCLAIKMDPSYFTRHSEPLELFLTTNIIDIVDMLEGPRGLVFAADLKINIAKLFLITPISCTDIEHLQSQTFFNENGDVIFFKMDQTEDAEYFTFTNITNHVCIKQSYLMYIIIGIVVVFVVLIIVLVFIVMIYLRKRRAAQMHTVQPEGRTYRETQIVLQIENAGLLKTDL